MLASGKGRKLLPREDTRKSILLCQLPAPPRNTAPVPAVYHGWVHGPILGGHRTHPGLLSQACPTQNTDTEHENPLSMCVPQPHTLTETCTKEIWVTPRIWHLPRLFEGCPENAQLWVLAFSLPEGTAPWGQFC